MKINKLIYETGATSHAVNDLILFTDNTRELAEKRDSIYEAMYQMDLVGQSTNMPTNWDNTQFIKLLRDAKSSYYKSFPTAEDHGHIYSMTDVQNKEFCSLYLNDYNSWKSEHAYK